MPRTWKYRKHNSGLAFVEIKGRRMYLGKWGTAASRAKYHRLLAEANAELPPPPSMAPIVVNSLLRSFLRHAKARYVKNGQQTSEYRNYKAAIRPVKRLYGMELASDFGPRKLTAVRGELAKKHCRDKVNQHLYRIRRVWKFGVSNELVSETVWVALKSVEGLRKGEGIEREKIGPVSLAHVEATKKFVTPPVAAMIDFQLATGCRPSEAIVARGIDMTVRGDVWEYRPSEHKGEHHDIERLIFLGPKAQAVVKEWMGTDLNAYLWSPRAGRAHYFKTRRETATTKRYFKRVKSPRRAPGDRYTIGSYEKAIERACKRAGVPHWKPNQLRHAAATRIRAASGGIEYARVILGHRSAVTTEIYAEADLAKAAEIMRRIG